MLNDMPAISTCSSYLCNYLQTVLRNTSKVYYDQIRMRTWISKFKDSFKDFSRQQDVHEFLVFLIEKCKNLNNLTKFTKKSVMTCTNCQFPTTRNDVANMLIYPIVDGINNIESVVTNNCVST